MAKESTFKNMLVSLTLICLICSALLGLVNMITEDTIARSKAEKIEAGIRAVVPEYDNSPVDEKFAVEEAEVYPATLAGNAVGYAVLLSTEGFGGPLTMLVGFTTDGTVYNTSVLSHNETPGLGAKITDSSLPIRNQVVGLNPSATKVSVVKDGGQIDAITASTITSRAFLAGINRASEIILKVYESGK